MSRTRVKVCGVRTLEAARASVDAGADAIGFVFTMTSARYIDPVDASAIMLRLPPFVDTVGLFVNPSVEEYLDHAEFCPTSYGQLHGDESEKVVRECGPRVIKAIRFNAATITHELDRWAAIEEIDAILIDGSTGGKGESFDWSALAAAKLRAGSKPLIVAGGLTPANVGQAVRAVRPYAVDVSSGVERAPGEKDPALIAAFCEAVQRADLG